MNDSIASMIKMGMLNEKKVKQRAYVNNDL